MSSEEMVRVAAAGMYLAPTPSSTWASLGDRAFSPRRKRLLTNSHTLFFSSTRDNAQRLTVPSGSLKVSIRTVPLPWARALLMSIPELRATIEISNSANANLGIRMVSHPFSHKVEVLRCACCHAPDCTSSVNSTLANRRNSTPIFRYSFIRALHASQLPICSAASDGILSPSQSAERYS